MHPLLSRRRRLLFIPWIPSPTRDVDDRRTLETATEIASSLAAVHRGYQHWFHAALSRLVQPYRSAGR